MVDDGWVDGWMVRWMDDRDLLSLKTRRETRFSHFTGATEAKSICVVSLAQGHRASLTAPSHLRDSVLS